MQVIKYLDESHNAILSSLSEKIGDGADGEVFALKDSDNVIKFSIHYCWHEENLTNVINQRLRSFLTAKITTDTFVRVFKSGHLANGTRKIYTGSQDYAIFYYEMEKLLKISDDEKKVFHSTVSHEDSNVKKSLNLDKISNMLDGLSIGLEFDPKKVINFIKKVQNLASLGIHYEDLHPRNIMKTKDGDFKLIDIDRISVL